MSANNFSGWTQKDFLRWLRKNHPKPKDRWVQFSFHVRLCPEHVSEIT